MPDEILNADQTALNAGEGAPSTETESTETTATQPVEQPAWKAKYATPEKMWDENRKFMSEADRLRRENDNLRKQYQPQPQTKPTLDERLETLVKDPDAFVDERFMKVLMPLQVKVALTEFEQNYPDAKQYRSAMRELADADPKMLETQYGLQALYLIAKEQDRVNKVGEAATIKQAQKAEVQQVKKTDAFVESSSQPKRDGAPTLKEGMSIAESEKALAALGIGTIPE